MTTVILLRHAHSIANEKGVLAGRASGIALSKKGLIQAKDLTSRLGNLKFKSIRISPMERCLLTLEPWLKEQKLAERDFVLDKGLTEVDYGDWTGKKLSLLALKKEWKIVQRTPSKMVFPDGESLLQVQKRANESLMKAVKEAQGGAALIVSHGDVIKSIIANCLDLKLDKFQKIVIDPASISVLDYSNKNFRLLHLNDSSTNFDFLSKKSRSMKTLVGGGSGRK
jgi:probable phosphomutase (TIGR03848 family)